MSEKLKIIDGRGLHMVERKKKKTEEIKKYIHENPEALRSDICGALKISAQTLRAHLKIINKA